jgi:hypothetical protein
MKISKTMKKILKISSGVLAAIVLICSSCKVYYNNFYANKSPSAITKAFTNEIVWTPIKWTTDEYSDRASLFIPVKIDTISNRFYMQFDLGVQRTRITSLNKGFPYLAKYTADGKYKDLPIYLGNNEKYIFNQKKDVDYQMNKPEDFIAKDTNTFIKIGDIGYDYIKGRILITDFINSRYSMADELPKEFESKVSWINSKKVRAKKWSVHIPIKINDTERVFMYDNGSSKFTLYVSKTNWDNITSNGKNGKIDSLKLSSWGKDYYYMRALPTQKITTMFGEDLSNKKIFYGGQISEKMFNLMNSFEGVEGMIGNEYFRDKVLVIDTKTDRVGFYHQ